VRLQYHLKALLTHFVVKIHRHWISSNWTFLQKFCVYFLQQIAIILHAIYLTNMCFVFLLSSCYKYGWWRINQIYEEELKFCYSPAERLAYSWTKAANSDCLWSKFEGLSNSFARPINKNQTKFKLLYMIKIVLKFNIYAPTV
jgi:hypothetical protein